MILLQGVNVSNINPIGAASERSVMKNEGGAAANHFVVNAHTSIVGKWHVLAPGRRLKRVCRLTVGCSASRVRIDNRRGKMIVFSRICLSAFVGFIYCAAWNEQAHAQNDSAARLAPKGELRAALIASNPVLVTRGSDGPLGGVSVELARALAAKLGIPVRLMPYENPARYNESSG